MHRIRATAPLATRAALGALMMLLALPASAGDDFDFEVHGQYRPRFYYHGMHDFDGGTARAMMRHRARLGAGFDYKALVGAYVEVQDVRTFGEETSTLGDFSADGFDLHQAYTRIRPFEGFEIKIGRQEIALENHRLVGTVGWTEQARAFDGARVSYEWKALQAGAFWARVAEDFGGKNPSDVDLVAVNLRWNAHAWANVAALGVVDLSKATEKRRGTIGVLLNGAGCGFDYAVEGYYQTGSEKGGIDYASWLAAVKAGYTAPLSWKPFVDVFAELVSGDDDPTDGTVKTFDTLYATNHKFYGEMDFFLNLPVHSQGRGLMDIGGAIGATPHETVLTKVTVHHFRSMEDPDGAGDTFGTEVDLRINWAPIKHLKLDFVYGVFLPDELFDPAGDGAPEHLVFTTLDVSF